MADYGCAGTALASLAIGAAAVCTFGVAGAGAAQATGSVTCSKASIAQAVAKTGRVEGTTAKLGTGAFGCAGKWSYAIASVGSATQAVAVTLVFKRAATGWSLQNRAVVCRASAHLVPAALFKDACSTN